VRPLLSSNASSLLGPSISKLSFLLVLVFAARVLRVTDSVFFVALQALVLPSVTVRYPRWAPMLTREVSAGTSFLTILRRPVLVKCLFPLWAVGYLPLLPEDRA
jgi:hypothetical protein